MSLSRQTLLIRALLVGTLLAMAASAQAQGLPGYVSGVPAGDALYVSVGNRIETVRYIGIRQPEILHPTTRGSEPYEEVARAVNRQLVEGKWVTLILDAQPRDRYGSSWPMCTSATSSSTPSSSTEATRRPRRIRRMAGIRSTSLA